MNWPINFFRLKEEHFTFRLQYKHSVAFANCKYEELSYPKKFENVRPHFSNSIENATTSPHHRAFCPSTYYTYQAIYLIRGMFSREDCRKNWEGQELLSRENETSLDSGPYKKYLDAPLIHMPRFSSLQWVEH